MARAREEDLQCQPQGQNSWHVLYLFYVLSGVLLGAFKH